MDDLTPEQIETLGGGSKGKTVFVTGDLDLSTMEVTNISHTFDEMIAEINNGAFIRVALKYSNTAVAYGELNFYGNTFVAYTALMSADFGDGERWVIAKLNFRKNSAGETTVTATVDNLVTEEMLETLESEIAAFLNSNTHTHSNASVLNKFGEDENGNATYDGEIIKGDEILLSESDDGVYITVASPSGSVTSALVEHGKNGSEVSVTQDEEGTSISIFYSDGGFESYTIENTSFVFDLLNTDGTYSVDFSPFTYENICSMVSNGSPIVFRLRLETSESEIRYYDFTGFHSNYLSFRWEEESEFEDVFIHSDDTIEIKAGAILTESDKEAIANMVLANFTDVSEVGM